METILLLRKIYLQKIGKTLNTSLREYIFYMNTNLIDSIEIPILEIFVEIAMHLFICGIHDKQFDAILNYCEFIN